MGNRKRRRKKSEMDRKRKKEGDRESIRFVGKTTNFAHVVFMRAHARILLFIFDVNFKVGCTPTDFRK